MRAYIIHPDTRIAIPCRYPNAEMNDAALLSSFDDDSLSADIRSERDMQSFVESLVKCMPHVRLYPDAATISSAPGGAMGIGAYYLKPYVLLCHEHYNSDSVLRPGFKLPPYTANFVGPCILIHYKGHSFELPQVSRVWYPSG